jgi:hypothetical protein
MHINKMTPDKDHGVTGKPGISSCTIASGRTGIQKRGMYCYPVTLFTLTFSYIFQVFALEPS